MKVELHNLFYVRLGRLFFICTLIFVSILTFSVRSFSQVSAYTFSQDATTYAPVSQIPYINVIADDNSGAFNSATIPFTFNYNGVNYNAVTASSNGFLVMGAVDLTGKNGSGTAYTSTSNNTGLVISSATALNNVIAPLNADLNVFSYSITGTTTTGSNVITNCSGANFTPSRIRVGMRLSNIVTQGVCVPIITAVNFGAGTITMSCNQGDFAGTGTITVGSSFVFEESGVSPNRVFTAQWTNYKRYSTNDTLDFQVKLYESSNVIEFIYGKSGSLTSSALVKVGLRGNSNADYNIRTTTTNWSATTAGAVNTAGCTLNTTVKPASGLVYRFTPISCSGASGGTATGTTSFCGSGIPTITATGYSTGSGSGYQWESSNDNFVNNIQNVSGQTNPATLSTGTVTSTTYYRLKVTCTSGTSIAYSNTITVTIKPVPTAGASNNGPLCSNSSLNLTGTTNIGATFSWTGPNGFASTDQNPVIANAQVSAAGTYSFVASLDGCNSSTATTSVAITATPPTPTVTNYSVCLGAPVPPGEGISSTFAGSSTTSPGSQVIQFNVTAQPPNSLGNIIATATMPPLPANASVTSVVLSYPGITAQNPSYQSEVLLQLDGAVDWNFASSSPGAANGPGTFNYLVTLTSGFVINPAGGTISLLYGESFDDTEVDPDASFPIGTAVATLTINYTAPSAAGVAWYDALTGGNLIGTGSPFNPVGIDPAVPNTNTPGIHTYYAQVSNGACPSVRSAAIFSIGTSLTTSIISSTGGSTVCAGTDLTITASPSGGGLPYANFSWKIGTTEVGTSNNLVVSTASAGTTVYDLTVMDACGQTATASITVTVNALPAAVSVSTPGTYCGSTTLNATNGNDGIIYFQGTTSGGTSTATPSASQLITSSGTYYFRAQSAEGCWGPEGSAIVVINANPVAPTVTPSSPASICLGASQAFTVTGSIGTQTILSENFNSTAAGTTTSGNLPAGWSGASLTAGVRVWGVVASAQSGSTLGGGNFLYCESDGYSTQRTRAEVITPVFSATNYSTVSIKFKHYYNDLTSGANTDSARVFVSNDGGTNWTLAQQYDADQGTAFTSAGAVNASIPVGLALTANMRVKLLYNSDAGGNDWYWAVDDFVIDGTIAPQYVWTAFPSTDFDAGITAGAIIPSAANNNISFTPNTAGTYIYTATLVNSVTGCNSVGVSTAAITVNPNVNAGTVTGTSLLCIGATTTYTSNGDAGGTWSSDDALVATVDANTGFVTAIGAGTTNINYTINSGCGSPASASQSVTVNPNINPGTVSGTSPLSISQTTTYTTNGDAGGTWSSSNQLVASVDPGTGFVTALSGGSTNITYTINSGCGAPASSFQVLNVSGGANPGTISGTSPLCIGGTTTYTSNGDAGGTWSSSNPLVASVDPGTGFVTALSAGTTDITYTVAGPSASFKTLTVVSGAAPTVSGPTNVCPYLGNNVQVSYTANTPGASSYTWTLPPNVNLVSGAGTSTITVTFNAGFALQANKQLRVRANSVCGVSAQTIYYLLVQFPSTPAPIVASTNNVCPSLGTLVPITYTIPKVLGATSYVWSAQAGNTTITSMNGPGENDTTVTVTFSSSFSTSAITVQAVNDCGVSGIRSLTITRSNPSTPGLVSGPTNACAHITQGGTAATYTVAMLPNVTSYTWSVPAGAIGLTGQGSNSISFTYPAGFSSGTVSVVADNGCGSSGIRTLAISKLNPSTPGIIDVIQSNSCPNREYSYTVSSMPANATSVLWTVPAGATILSGQGTTSITVSYPSTAVAGTVTATAQSNCGNSVTRSVDVKLPACPIDEFAKGSVQTSQLPVDALSVQVFPNPAVSDVKLMVKTTMKEQITVRVLDLQGRELHRMIIMPDALKSFGSNLKAGAYMIEVLQGNKRTVQKLIKL